MKKIETVDLTDGTGKFQIPINNKETGINIILSLTSGAVCRGVKEGAAPLLAPHLRIKDQV